MDKHPIRIIIKARLTPKNIAEFDILVEGNNSATIQVNLK